MSFLPKNNFTTQWAFIFTDKLEERAKGEIIIDYVGGPEAMPSFDQAKAMADGVFDMNQTTPGYYVDILPEVDAFLLSQLTVEEEYEVGYYDFMQEIHARVNMRYLCHTGKGERSYFYTYLNVPVDTPYDLSGLKLRTSLTHIPFVEALGAIPISIGPMEIYTAMERGVVDGFTWPWIISDFGWPEVTKYVIDHPYHTGNSILVMNLDTWNRLPKHLQELITEVGREVQPDIETLNDRRHEEERQLWRDAGIEFIEFSPADAKWYVDLAYDTMWERLMTKAPENAAKLWDLITR